MKTAEEVAEELFIKVLVFPAVLTPSDVKRELAQALTAFAEERVKEAIDNIALCKGDDPIAKRIRAEALEDIRRYIDEKLANKS